MVEISSRLHLAALAYSLLLVPGWQCTTSFELW